LNYIKFHVITFLQGAMSLSRNCCVVDKDVRAATAPDETISPDIVKPFHIANHFAFLSINSVRSAYMKELHKSFLKLLSPHEMSDAGSIAPEPDLLLEADTFGPLMSLPWGNLDSSSSVGSFIKHYIKKGPRAD
jgi:hypothetical protein